jgi:hypothetical protein
MSTHGPLQESDATDEINREAKERLIEFRTSICQTQIEQLRAATELTSQEMVLLSVFSYRLTAQLTASVARTLDQSHDPALGRTALDLFNKDTDSS